MNRTPVVTGNWKMYKTVSEATTFVKDLAALLNDSQVTVRLAVPFTAIFPSVMEAKETSIEVGAQNMHDATEGAFTGEISGTMLREAGAKFVVLGHSERRHIFSESNAFINRKVRRAIGEKLQVTLCIGETEQQREEGRTKEVLAEQILQSLEGVSPEEMTGISLAYEPVWAIGTGQAATPENAQEMHATCRAILAEHWGEQVAAACPIQYGGSVKPSNARALFAMPDIDGMLVGGASLTASTFNEIIQACNVKECLS